ncbi:hypothetical protein ONZ45_g14070 [Pleurotus djamor]|nr:hypothetical protein ONZ45_g14070 [Pleurotus djamor]
MTNNDNNDIQVGDTVSWKWGQGNPEGKVAHVYEEDASIKSKNGNTLQNPAIEIKQKNGNPVLKKASELN